MKIANQTSSLIFLIVSVIYPAYSQAQQPQQQQQQYGQQQQQQPQQCQQQDGQQQQQPEWVGALMDRVVEGEKYRVRIIQEIVRLKPGESSTVGLPGLGSDCKPNHMQVTCFEYVECPPCQQCQQQQFQAGSMSGYDGQGHGYTLLPPGGSIFVADKVYTCALQQRQHQQSQVVCR